MPISHTELHPFERANLGIAPFVYNGMTISVGPIRLKDGSECGAPGQPMGSCDYCGTGIKYVFHIKSADSKKFVVGSDCVAKLARTDNERRDPVIAAIQREARQIINDNRIKNEKKKIEAADLALKGKAELFESLPHPKIPNKTLADYLDWMYDNAGHTGRFKVAKLIEKTIKASSKKEEG